ncbi:HnRNP A1-gamma isoform [Mycena indigotica]|uniref:HnRNP A1-gamma isoform n=1 Tax=Mycena indigotica TaxID=2126181 RepID=A0A8H6SKV6_9AGAR|nr:HnRNP A1-gamma isoform [Mycena indigotica]KAF7301266.1 HnRNP A1-gamma isoform [Mycena indigotica]
MSSKGAVDDLYGDIYGDEELEILDSEAQLVDAPEVAPIASVSTKPEPHHALPPKPVSQAASSPATSNSNSLSYSAQIAQQFSAYKQTPSQERQQRPPEAATSTPIPTFENLETSPIPTHATQTYVSGDTVFGKKPSEMHDSGKMFIGGLNWETTDEGLRNYFSQFGKVDACTIMRDPSGTSRGFAFMTFEDAASVSLVLGKEHVLDGKAIDPKRAIPREEHLRNTRYFVGGLSPNTTSESMKAFFSSYGKVVDATVMVDRETGRGKGFGFVTFEDATNADQLVGKLGLQIDDKEIEVKMAQPRSQRDRERTGPNNSSQQQVSAIPTFSSQTQQQPQQQQQQQVPMPIPMMFARPGMMNGMAGMNAMGMGGMGNMMGVNPMMMGMNPMSMMGMGMMNGMGAMNNMAMNNMAQMGMGGPMRMGMGGPMAAMGGAGAMGMGNMTMPTLRGGMGINFGRTPAMTNGSGGPARISTRGQHSFHPYSR